MKKLLILIHDLDAGGAQKSLVSFLNTLSPNYYDIHIMPIHKNGIFINNIPSNMNLIDSPLFLKSMTTSILDKLFWKEWNFKSLTIKISAIIKIKFNRDNCSYNQKVWKYWNKHIGLHCENYDIAMSYMDGFCNYFVLEKVNAKKKIIWIHNDYNKLSNAAPFDLPIYSKADYIVTISNLCKTSLINNFPILKSKINVLANISSKQMINKMASHNDNLDKIFNNNNNNNNKKKVSLLSIGRLDYQKGFDIALDVASELKKRGCDFSWFIIGDGPLKGKLLNKLEILNLGDCFFFLGKKSNPYSYLANTDLFIQPSRFEGKSIVLDEAKILCKPIIATNYTTVTDSIINGKNGIIVDLSVEGLTNEIIDLINNPAKATKLSSQLSKENHSNENEIEKYLNILD